MLFYYTEINKHLEFFMFKKIQFLIILIKFEIQSIFLTKYS